MELSSHLTAPGALLAAAREIGPARPAASPRAKRLLALTWAAAAALLVALALHGGGAFVHAIERAARSGGWRLVGLGALLEAASLGGYIALLHRLAGGAARGLRLRDSYDITLAGTAATRLLPTAGLGGAAVTSWALRARGMRAGEVAERLIAFLLLIYAVYMAALLVLGASVALGLTPVAGGRPLGVLAVAVSLSVSAAVLTLLAAPSIAAAALARIGTSAPRFARHAERAAEALPSLRAALVRAGSELRRPSPALLGALAWWAFDIGVLVAMLHAFAAPLPVPVVVLAYFLGTMFNLLPLPGSLSGGLAGTLVVFGAPAAGALAAVMAYRTIAVWLPAASGVPSLLSLRRTVAGWHREGAASRTGADLLPV